MNQRSNQHSNQHYVSHRSECKSPPTLNPKASVQWLGWQRLEVIKQRIRNLTAGFRLQSLNRAFVLFAIACIACTPTISAPSLAPELKPVKLDDTVEIVAGQTLYVPVYSHIYMVEQGRTMNLTTTLSLRNTDRRQPIIIASVDYYNSSGKLVRNYLEQPVQLDPLAASEFVVPQADTSGGIGASFLVEWVAQAAVSEPVVEAIMINTSGNQGLSFVSLGRVIESRP